MYASLKMQHSSISHHLERNGNDSRTSIQTGRQAGIQIQVNHLSMMDDKTMAV